MIRARIGQAALRAYPPAVRQTRGPEMLGMLLDAGERSKLAFVRESGSLVLGGLRERGAITARAGTRRLLADACCQAVLILLTLWIISALNTSQQLEVQAVVVAAILACALIGYERIAAFSGLAAIAAYGPLGPHTQLVLLAKVLVSVLCLLVMVCAPRKRPRDPHRLIWLVPVAALAALHAHAYVSLPEVLALVSLGGLLRLFYDPRLAIACSLVWIRVLSTHAGRSLPAGPRLLDLAAVAAGLVLTIAAGRLWIMRASAAA
ncbi:MAG: hypothetical protein ACLP0J_05640 [Solirubrobacteraceae bacterium]